MCFAQRGCYSAISVAAAHDQRATLRKLLSHPLAPVSREVLSLEEMLAEGDNSARNGVDRSNDVPSTLSKSQMKCLQEAMYHSAESNYLGENRSPSAPHQIHRNHNKFSLFRFGECVDITIELRALGVPWTLHCWMHALSAAHELRLDTVIDQLLQDFLQVCPDDYSSQFVTECLPLLFNIFRHSKVSRHLPVLRVNGCAENENKNCTFFRRKAQHCCWPIFLPLVSVGTPSNQSKNHCCNRWMDHVSTRSLWTIPNWAMLCSGESCPIRNSLDFQRNICWICFYRVEGKIFYGHKIVLVTASPRFQNMLGSKLSDGNMPTVQINDIRYHIFRVSAFKLLYLANRIPVFSLSIFHRWFSRSWSCNICTVADAIHSM